VGPTDGDSAERWTKVIAALPTETRRGTVVLGRVPKKEEIERVFLLTRVMYKAVLSLHYRRQEQKKTGQLAIF
jgi:hypothetical protein